MSVLPSPIPHPLEFSPWELPGWAYEALEWVVGFDWPDGNEAATWDVADRWYALATKLAAPATDADAAAGQILGGYSGAGADAFEDAWQGVPLESLIEVAQELGTMVEECGCDIEGAKIEAWIELGLFVIELIGMAVAVAATLGAASPAAGGLIAATRVIIQQIFRRLVEQLSRKALRQAGSRAVKQLSTRAGRMALARGALHEGLDEAREEFATNALIQGYQNTTGRRDGVDVADLGLSTAAGFGGGFASGGAHVGAGHGPHGVGRGAAAEILGEFGGAAVTGDLPDLESVAKSASSGGIGSAMSGPSTPDLSGLKIPAPPSLDGASPLDNAFPLDAVATAAPPLDPARSDSAGSVGSVGSAGSAGSDLAGSDHGGPGQRPAGAGLSALGSEPPPAASPPSTVSSPTPALAAVDRSDIPVISTPGSSGADPSLAGSSPTPSPPDPTQTPRPANPDLNPPTAPSPPVPSPSAGLHAPGPSTSLPAPGPSTADPSGSRSGVRPIPDPGQAPRNDLSPPGTVPTRGHTPSRFGQVPSPDTTSPVRPSPPDSSPPRSRTSPLVSPPSHEGPSDLDLIAAALGPGAPAAPPRQRTPTPPQDQQQIDAYVGYLRDSRNSFEADRRERDARALHDESEGWANSAGRLTREAADARAQGFTMRADDLSASARTATSRSEVLSAQAILVASGDARPPRTQVEFEAWTRLNDDLGILTSGGVDTDTRSRITDDDIPAPVERSRPYDVPGGLRRPLAVHQKELEQAVPKDHNNRPLRRPDPREGTWFGLANDGGPEADATRGINCVDGVLSLFDTYVHGRPRVSAPRTFDSYAVGDPLRPLGPETAGRSRIEDTIQGGFVDLTPPGPPTKQSVARALQNLSRQLLSLEHGAFAFIITQSSGGDAHAWAAVNHGGTVLFLDPQTRKLSEDIPLYTHTGFQGPSNVVSVSALLTNPQGEYSTIPAHLSPHTSNAPDPEGWPFFDRARAAERQALESLPETVRATLQSDNVTCQGVADRTLSDLRKITSDLNPKGSSAGPRLFGTEHRVKTQESIARTIAPEVRAGLTDISRTLNDMKDRVRFTVQLSEANYVESVTAVLDRLRERGYRATRKVSFWGPGGRHNGLNVSVVDRTGMKIEIQFPTELSRKINGRTHKYYETIRQKDFDIAKKVRAFLKMVAMNKRAGMNERQPSGIESIQVDKTVDSSFAEWLKDIPDQWELYNAKLASKGKTFDSVMSRYGLDWSDLSAQGGRLD